MKSTIALDEAKAIIFAQDVPRNLQRSGLLLFEHECGRTDPETGKKYTKEKALANVLDWMLESKARRERSRRMMLTPMERQVLQMLVNGLTQRQISIELKKNIRNVRRCFTRVRRRLGVGTLYQVIAISVSYGWVDIAHPDQ